MYSVVYSSANSSPNAGGYNFTTGVLGPILPTVGLFSSFSFELFAKAAYTPSPTERGGTYARGGGYGYRQVPQYPPLLIFDNEIGSFKVITGMEWVTDGGPNGNGVAQNERGDWFTLDALTKPDKFGLGIKLETVAETGNVSVVYPAIEGTPIQEKTRTVPAWNHLRISGSYNSAVFCYNEFGYLDNNESGEENVKVARTLYELPENFDQLVRFIPDQRPSTTITFYVRVFYSRSIEFGSYESLLSSGDKDFIRNKFSSVGLNNSDSEIHAVPHIINNNNNNWNRILQETLTRQRTKEQQDSRYGKNFQLKVIQ